MQAINQEAIAKISHLPDDADISDIIADLDKMKLVDSTTTAANPVDTYFGALGSGRLTDTVMTELQEKLQSPPSIRIS